MVKKPNESFTNNKKKVDLLWRRMSTVQNSFKRCHSLSYKNPILYTENTRLFNLSHIAKLFGGFPCNLRRPKINTLTFVHSTCIFRYLWMNEIFSGKHCFFPCQILFSSLFSIRWEFDGSATERLRSLRAFMYFYIMKTKKCTGKFPIIRKTHAASVTNGKHLQLIIVAGRL